MEGAARFERKVLCVGGPAAEVLIAAERGSVRKYM